MNTKIFSGLLMTAAIAFIAYYSFSCTTVIGDFLQDYFAGIALRQGTPIYGDALRELPKRSFGIENIDNFHTPFSAIVALPFSYLPYQFAFQLWNLTSILLYLLMVFGLLEGAGLSEAKASWFAPFLILWPPILFSIRLGQWSLMIAFLVYISWRFLKLNRDDWSGAALAVATLMKIYPGFIAIFFLFSRRYAALRSFIAVLLMGSLLTFLVCGWGNIYSYLVLVIPRDAAEFSLLPINISIFGVIRPLFFENQWVTPIWLPSMAGDIFATTCAFLVAIIALYSSLKLCRIGEEDRAYSVLVVSALLISPVVWWHGMPMMLLPLFVLLGNCKTPISRSTLGAVILIAVLVTVPDAYVARFIYRNWGRPMSPGAFLLIKLPTIGLFMLWLFLMKRSSDPPS